MGGEGVWGRPGQAAGDGRRPSWASLQPVLLLSLAGRPNLPEVAGPIFPAGTLRPRLAEVPGQRTLRAAGRGLGLRVQTRRRGGAARGARHGGTGLGAHARRGQVRPRVRGWARSVGAGSAPSPAAAETPPRRWRGQGGQGARRRLSPPLDPPRPASRRPAPPPDSRALDAPTAGQTD